MSTIVITLAGEGSGDGSGDGNEGEEPANPSVATVIFSETFATSLGEFTTENTVLPDELSYVWAYNSYGYAKASGYYKQAYAAESWLISPVIDLTGCTNCSLAFSSAINYATDFATAYIRVEGGEWVALEGVNYGTGTSWDFVDNNISIAAYDGKKIQLGFKYTSTTEAAGTWELKNLSVSGTKDDSSEPTEPTEPSEPVTSNVVFSETFATSLGDFTIEDTNLPEGLSYVWAYNSYGYAKASGYYKQAYAAESWLISPVIDLTGRTGCALAFSSALNYASNCVGAFAREEGGQWVGLEDVDYGTGSSWTFSDNEGIDLSAFDGKKIQLGFQYTSTADAAATWEIKNLVVTGNVADGIFDVEVENAPVEYFNIQGVRVENPENGLFIRRQGNKVSKVVIR
jgi:hypothetical protein